MCDLHVGVLMEIGTAYIYMPHALYGTVISLIQSYIIWQSLQVVIRFLLQSMGEVNTNNKSSAV